MTLQVLGQTEAWWVWIGDAPAKRVADESEALNLLRQQGRDYEIPNRDNRSDMACPVVEILWNRPLEPGQTAHKTVCSPAMTVLRNGELRRVIRHISPSKLKSQVKSWSHSEPRFPAWWPKQYLDAVEDPETLVLRGSKSLLDQVDARWPMP